MATPPLDVLIARDLTEKSVCRPVGDRKSRGLEAGGSWRFRCAASAAWTESQTRRGDSCEEER